MNAALNGSIRGRGNPGAKRGGSGANTPSGQPVQSTASPSNSAARPQSQAPPRWGHAQGNPAHNAGTGPGQAATKGVQSPVVNGVGHGSEPADPRMRDRLLMLTLTLVVSFNCMQTEIRSLDARSRPKADNAVYYRARKSSFAQVLMASTSEFFQLLR